MEFITNDGIKLNFHSFGTGQPVVLVAGFGGYQEIWYAQVDYLVEMHCRVITYDHRNHGRSQRTDQNLTIEQLTTDLADLIDYLQLQKPILIGHSMGASICYAYLSKYSNALSVMAVDQSPKMLNDPDWKFGFEDINSKNFQQKLTQPNNVHETLHGLDSQVFTVLNQAKSEFPFDRKSNHTLLFDHVQQDWRTSLFNTRIPVTLVVAKQSPYFDFHFGEFCQQKNSLITSVTMNNCGHDIMAEIPDEFNQTLRHFIFSSQRN